MVAEPAEQHRLVQAPVQEKGLLHHCIVREEAPGPRGGRWSGRRSPGLRGGPWSERRPPGLRGGALVGTIFSERVLATEEAAACLKGRLQSSVKTQTMTKTHLRPRDKRGRTRPTRQPLNDHQAVLNVQGQCEWLPLDCTLDKWDRAGRQFSRPL